MNMRIFLHFMLLTLFVFQIKSFWCLICLLSSTSPISCAFYFYFCFHFLYIPIKGPRVQLRVFFFLLSRAHTSLRILIIFYFIFFIFCANVCTPQLVSHFQPTRGMMLPKFSITLILLLRKHGMYFLISSYFGFF